MMDTVPDSLRGFFEDHPKLALAFSGGADSSYLLYAALECKADVTAYLVKSQLQPESELDDAIRTADALGAELHILLENALTENIVKNGKDRCYHCKRRLFSRILEQARSDKKYIVIDATNASDECSDRPGMKALEELGILSPLRMCGMTKPEIRELSKEAGLWTWNMPSNSCLATRIPTGVSITEDKLRSVEEAESRIGRFGFSQFRVRLADDSACLETLETEKQMLDDNKEEIERILLEYRTSVRYGIRSPSL